MNCKALVMPRIIGFAMVIQILTGCTFLSAQQTSQNERLLVKHNSRLLLKRQEQSRLILISIVSDQILSSSRAYVHAWSFDDVEQMSEYLRSQDQSGIVIPKEIQLSRSTHVSLTSFEKFAIDGIRFQWVGGNQKASWLKIENSDFVEALSFDRMTRGFRPFREKFEPWKEFTERQNQTNHENSWTEFAGEEK